MKKIKATEKELAATKAKQELVEIEVAYFEQKLSLEQAIAALPEDIITTITLEVQEDWKRYKHIMPEFLRPQMSDAAPKQFAQKQFLVHAQKLMSDQAAIERSSNKKRSCVESDPVNMSANSRAGKSSSDGLKLQSCALGTDAVVEVNRGHGPNSPSSDVASSKAGYSGAGAIAQVQAGLDQQSGRRGQAAEKTQPAAKNSDVTGSALVVHNPKGKMLGTMQLVSPGRHLNHNMADFGDVNCPLTRLTSVDILRHVATSAIRWSYVGFVVHRGEVRTNPDTKKAGAWKQLCDFILADSEAPVCITLRDDELTRFLNVLDAAAAQTTMICVQIENYRIIPTEATLWNGVVLTTMNRVQAINAGKANPSTIVHVISEAIAKLRGQPIRELSADVCITDWDHLQQPLPAPSRLSLAGIVETVDEVVTGTSLDGPSKKKCKFTLIDVKGRWLLCSAKGFNAEATALQIGYEVILWFATVLKALGNEPARCAVLDDAVIVAAGEVKALIPRRIQQIQFVE